MATVVNFIDVTLRGAAARTVNLASAQILLTPSAPAFHVDVDGVVTPETITFTATLIDLDTLLTFNATGAPLTNPTAKSVTIAGASMTGSSVTVIASATVNGQLYTGPCTISKFKDGKNGLNGDGANLSAGDLKAILEGQITTDQLTAALTSRISLIDGGADVAGSVTARVKAETDARIAAISQASTDNRTYVQQYTYSQQTINDSFSAFGTNIQAAYQGYANGAADGALAAAKSFAQSYSYSKADADSSLTATANQLRSEFATLNQGAGATVAWVQEYAYSKAQANDAIASATQQLSTTVAGHTSTLEIQGQSISGFGAQYTVKIDNNGYMAGYGLASTPINGVPTSSFIVLADRFAVALPGQAAKYPFVIGTVNGQTVIGLRGDVVLDGTLNIRTAAGIQDVSSLVKRSNFDDGAMGQWQGVGTENKGGTRNESIPFAKTLLTRSRDALEAGNVFPVTPNERIYFSVWMNTEATSYRGGFGMFLLNAAGQVVGYPLPCTLTPGNAWTYVEGSVVIPDGVGAVNACPWLWQEGQDFNNGNWLRAAGMWIGRHARGATVGADQSNLNAGLGARNLLNNTLPNGLGSYNSAFADGATGLAAAYYPPGHDWAVFSPENRGCIGVRCLGNVGARMDIYYAPRVTITPGQRYEFSATTSSHRARSWVNIAWYRADGSYISEVAGSPLGDYAWNTGWVGSPPPRVVVFAVAPADAVVAMPFLRMTKLFDSSTDSYLFASQLYMGEALPAQTVGSPYSPGLMEARDLAVIAQVGLQNKIDTNASSILRAPITITTGGGVVVGSLMYNATNGLYGSGSGVAITPYGIIGHDGNKYTFGISGATGAAFFGGELQAAYGTFGALRIAPGGYIAQGAFDGSWAWPASGGGFLVHANGLLFGNRNDPASGFFSIGSNGVIEAPGLSYTNRQLRLDSPVIINPVLSPFNISVTNSQNQYNYTLWRGSTDAYAGLYTVSISTGADGAAINWTVSGPWPCWLVQDSNSTRMQLHINMKGGAPLAGDSGDFYINCSVTKGGNMVNTQQLVNVTAS
jgi:hypothetical protein